MLGKIKKIHSGYINFGDIKGFWKNKKDYTHDGKPHLQCLESFYIGIKENNHIFNKDDLDSDTSWDHTVWSMTISTQENNINKNISKFQNM